MNDTSHATQKKLRQLWRDRSGQERLAMACAMFDDAKAMILSELKAGHPNASAKELRRMLFSHIYGMDFSAEKLAKILKSL